jgi:hypothetical protein
MLLGQDSNPESHDYDLGMLSSQLDVRLAERSSSNAISSVCGKGLLVYWLTQYCSYCPFALDKAVGKQAVERDAFCDPRLYTIP